jgi:hypothetical protein
MDLTLDTPFHLHSGRRSLLFGNTALAVDVDPSHHSTVQLRVLGRVPGMSSTAAGRISVLMRMFWMLAAPVFPLWLLP